MRTKLLPQPIQDNVDRLYPSSNLKSGRRRKIFLKTSKKFSLEEKNKIVLEGQSGSSSIEDICLRENITPDIFCQWSKEFLGDISTDIKKVGKRNFTDDERFRIVLDGLNGQFSVAEICRIEHISHDEFLSWSHDFMEVVKNKSYYFSRIDENEIVRKKTILSRYSSDVQEYLESFVNLFAAETILIDDSVFNLHFLRESRSKSIIYLEKLNNIRRINKRLELLNQKMDAGEILVSCFETFRARKERIWVNKIPLLRNLYFSVEFLFKRILPKLNLTKRFYFNFTRGKDRLLSKAEGLGRLVSCGFKIMDYKSIDGIIYAVVQKEREPSYDLNPSYGPIYAMPRLGKNGKIIKVYKLRTMHPYSEYLQDYIVRANGYAETGKPANDFRVPSWGKIMRRYWLDELPQLINFFKGDLKLIGIRPVSKRYFEDIPKEMQKLRLTQKPGCIPPYVSLNRSGNVMSVLQAEREYLEEKIRRPYTTDSKYFLKAIYNIIFKHKRSA